ncbi:hypothetical protein ACFVVU_19795 [Kitasatospora sp. NPDC057965]|uniref:hypothetical protein n=1 Tax=Kitasatospora sp. NPDC057965 TaxID=3346291 RepID=UPI0036D89CDE
MSTARVAVAGAIVAALALTACGPENDDTAAPPPATATAQPTAQPTATATATAQPTTTATTTTQPTTTAKPSSPAPAGKRQVVGPMTAGGLAKTIGQDAVSDVAVDPGEMRDNMHMVLANYDRPGQTSGRRILLIAVDNIPEDPAKRREHLWRGMIDYALQNGSTGTPTTATPFAAGPLGGSLECLKLPEAPTTDVVCGWSDASTAGVALFPRTTPAEAAALFAKMRGDIEK